MNEELPNGLHDAEILSFTYNIANRILSFEVDVWIGTMDQPTTLRERYKRGTLRFEGVHFFSKGEPERLSDSGLQFLDWTLEENLEEREKLAEPFEGRFFYFYAWCCEMRVGCDDVHFEWATGSETNRSPNDFGTRNTKN